MDIKALVEKLLSENAFMTLARNVRAQFGRPNKRYLGATILPERVVATNAFEETEIRYRTVIANHGTRYSPAQIKGEQEIIGSFWVMLGDQSIARQLSARDYDGLIELLGGGRTEQAMGVLTNWTDTAVNLGLIELNEKDRWDALVHATVYRRGDNAYAEDVKYSNPPGHRVVAGGDWSDNTYDPWDDILAQALLLKTKGYTINRIITSERIVAILSGNLKVQQRVGSSMVFNLNGTISTFTQTASLDQINNRLRQDRLPTIETYDEQYYTQAGNARFMPDDVWIMLATTGRQEVIDLGDQLFAAENTLGYHAIGRPTGVPTSGRVIRAWALDDLPPRVKSEGWQTSLPVITEPEAITVITDIQ